MARSVFVASLLLAVFLNSTAITGTNAESDTGNNVGVAAALVIKPVYLPIIFKLG